MAEVVLLSRAARRSPSTPVEAHARTALADAGPDECRERLRRCARVVAAFLRRAWGRPVRIEGYELVGAVARFCRTGSRHARLLLHRLEPAWCAEWSEGWIDLALEPWAALIERRLPTCVRRGNGLRWYERGGLALPQELGPIEADETGALRALAAAPALHRHWPTEGLAQVAGDASGDLQELGLLDDAGRLVPARLAVLVRPEDVRKGLRRSDWRVLWDWEARRAASLLAGRGRFMAR